MTKSNKTFRDKLLEMEKPNSALKEKYEREVQAMIEKKLTGLRKLGTVVSLVMGLGFFVLFGTLAVIVPKEFPLWGRAIWAFGALFGSDFNKAITLTMDGMGDFDSTLLGCFNGNEFEISYKDTTLVNFFVSLR